MFIVSSYDLFVVFVKVNLTTQEIVFSFLLTSGRRGSVLNLKIVPLSNILDDLSSISLRVLATSQTVTNFRGALAPLQVVKGSDPI